MKKLIASVVLLLAVATHAAPIQYDTYYAESFTNTVTLSDVTLSVPSFKADTYTMVIIDADTNVWSYVMATPTLDLWPEQIALDYMKVEVYKQGPKTLDLLPTNKYSITTTIPEPHTMTALLLAGITIFTVRRFFT